LIILQVVLQNIFISVILIHFNIIVISILNLLKLSIQMYIKKDVGKKFNKSEESFYDSENEDEKVDKILEDPNYILNIEIKNNKLYNFSYFIMFVILFY